MRENVGTDVGCKTDDGVFEIDFTTLRVGDGSFVEDLKKDHGYVFMCFLEFVEEDYGLVFG